MIALHDEPLDLAAVHRYLASPHAGGEVVFTGTVRDHNEGHAVSHLEFEAYPEMALAQLHAIAEEIKSRWNVTKVALLHRVGRVGIGDVCVIVGVSAPHRADAFEGCRHGIDTLKRDVAIWKRETTPEGEFWLSNHP
ncbi:MAG TPA: molybdenum cofactor biosynthesis protein MoaE [Oscillatoriaceae cyanobacterium]